MLLLVSEASLLHTTKTAMSNGFLEKKKHSGVMMLMAMLIVVIMSLGNQLSYPSPSLPLPFPPFGFVTVADASNATEIEPYMPCNAAVAGRLCLATAALDGYHTRVAHPSDEPCVADHVCTNPCPTQTQYGLMACLNKSFVTPFLDSTPHIPMDQAMSPACGGNFVCAPLCMTDGPPFDDEFLQPPHQCHDAVMGEAPTARDIAICPAGKVCRHPCVSGNLNGTIGAGGFCFVATPDTPLPTSFPFGAPEDSVGCKLFCVSACERGLCASNGVSAATSQCDAGFTCDSVCVDTGEICRPTSEPVFFGGTATPCTGTDNRCVRACPTGSECTANHDFIQNTTFSSRCMVGHSCKIHTPCPAQMHCAPIPDTATNATATSGCGANEMCAPSCPYPFFCWANPLPAQWRAFNIIGRCGAGGELGLCGFCPNSGEICKPVPDGGTSDGCGAGFSCQPPCAQGYSCQLSADGTTEVGCPFGSSCQFTKTATNDICDGGLGIKRCLATVDKLPPTDPLMGYVPGECAEEAKGVYCHNPCGHTDATATHGGGFFVCEKPTNEVLAIEMFHTNGKGKPKPCKNIVKPEGGWSLVCVHICLVMHIDQDSAAILPNFPRLGIDARPYSADVTEYYDNRAYGCKDRSDGNTTEDDPYCGMGRECGYSPREFDRCDRATDPFIVNTHICANASLYASDPSVSVYIGDTFPCRDPSLQCINPCGDDKFCIRAEGWNTPACGGVGYRCADTCTRTVHRLDVNTDVKECVGSCFSPTDADCHSRPGPFMSCAPDDRRLVCVPAANAPAPTDLFNTTGLSPIKYSCAKGLYCFTQPACPSLLEKCQRSSLSLSHDAAGQPACGGIPRYACNSMCADPSGQRCQPAAFAEAEFESQKEGGGACGPLDIQFDNFGNYFTCQAAAWPSDKCGAKNHVNYSATRVCVLGTAENGIVSDDEGFLNLCQSGYFCVETQGTVCPMFSSCGAIDENTPAGAPKCGGEGTACKPISNCYGLKEGGIGVFCQDSVNATEEDAEYCGLGSGRVCRYQSGELCGDRGRRCLPADQAPPNLDPSAAFRCPAGMYCYNPCGGGEAGNLPNGWRADETTCVDGTKIYPDMAAIYGTANYVPCHPDPSKRHFTCVPSCTALYLLLPYENLDEMVRPRGSPEGMIHVSCTPDADLSELGLCSASNDGCGFAPEPYDWCQLPANGARQQLRGVCTSNAAAASTQDCPADHECTNPCPEFMACGYVKGHNFGPCGGNGRGCVSYCDRASDWRLVPLTSDSLTTMDACEDSACAQCIPHLKPFAEVACLSLVNNSRCVPGDFATEADALLGGDIPCYPGTICVARCPLSSSGVVSYCAPVDPAVEPWFAGFIHDNFCGGAQGVRCVPSSQPSFGPFEHCDANDTTAVCTPISSSQILTEDASVEGVCGVGYKCVGSCGGLYSGKVCKKSAFVSFVFADMSVECGGHGTVCEEMPTVEEEMTSEQSNETETDEQSTETDEQSTEQSTETDEQTTEQSIETDEHSSTEQSTETDETTETDEQSTEQSTETDEQTTEQSTETDEQSTETDEQSTEQSIEQSTETDEQSTETDEQSTEQSTETDEQSIETDEHSSTETLDDVTEANATETPTSAASSEDDTAETVTNTTTILSDDVLNIITPPPTTPTPRPTPSLRPPPPTIPPAAVANTAAPLYLSSEGYGGRYPHYPTPAPTLTTITGGVPLPFARGFEWFHTRRFMQVRTVSSQSSLTAGGGGIVGLTLRQSIAPTPQRSLFDAAGSSSTEAIGYGVGISRTTSRVDFYAVNGRQQLKWAHFDNVTNVPPLSPFPVSSTTTKTNLSTILLAPATAIECGALMNAAPVAIASRVMPGQAVSLMVEVGPQAATSQCAKPPTASSSSSLTTTAVTAWSGVVYSSRPFTRAPTMSFVYMYGTAASPSFHPTAADEEEGSTTSHHRSKEKDLLIAGFVLGNASLSLNASWSGADTELPHDLFTAITHKSSFVFQGDAAGDQRASVRPPTVVRRMALMVPVKAYTTTVASWASGGAVDAIAISENTSATVGCHSGDMSSYDGSYVAPNTPIPSASIGGAPSSCYLFDTVDDIHLACDQRSDCVGFTSIRMPGPKERPLCLYLRTSSSSSSSSTSSSSSDVMPYQRMLYKKPDLNRIPSCNTVVRRSGVVGVFVQQTSLASSSVSVRVNGELVAVCGQSRPFANGVLGSDGRCGVYTLCFGGRVPTNAHIEVSSAAGGIRQSGCENSLGVVIQQVSVDAAGAEQTATTMPPIPTLSPAVTQRFGGAKKRVSYKGSRVATIKVFAHKAVGVALSLRQTGFSCAQYQLENPGKSCPETAVTLSTETSCQSCGGSKGFLGGYEGLSDRCGTEQFCGPMMNAARKGSSSQASTCETNGALSIDEDVAFTGAVSVVVDGARLSYATDECKLFDGFVYASKQRQGEAGGRDSIIPVFPIVRNSASSMADDGLQEIFIGVPASLAETDASFKTRMIALLGLATMNATAILPDFAANNGGAAPITADLATATVERMLTLSTPSFSSSAAMTTTTLAYVNWDTLFMYDYPAAKMSSNITQYCFVDHSENGQTARCQFVIPRFATRVRVSAAQIDFAAEGKTMTVEVYPFGMGSSSGNDIAKPSSTASCGGDRSKRFSGKLGEQAQCGVFLDCTDQFIYTDDRFANENVLGVVVVSLPANLQTFNCSAFSAIVSVTFSSSGVAAPADLPAFTGCDKQTEFECAGERKCIPLSGVCDGIQGCASGADEAECGGWTSITDEAFCVPQTAMIVASSGGGEAFTFDVCRRVAIQNQSRVFTLSGDGSTCTVYTSAISPLLLANPAGYICDQAGAETYLAPSNPSTFGLCRSRIQCRSKGNATLIESTGACVCVCSSGFVGSDCASRRKLESYSHIVVSFNVPEAVLQSNPSLESYVYEATVANALTLRSRIVRVQCDDYFPLAALSSSSSSSSLSSSRSLNLACSVGGDVGVATSADVAEHFKRLLSSKALGTINSVLEAAGHPLVASVSGRTMMNPIVDMGECNNTQMSDDALNDMNSTAPRISCGATESFDKLRLNLFRNVSVKSAVVTISSPPFSAFASSQRSMSTMATTTAQCTPASSYIAGGCLRSQCDLDISGSPSDIITVSDIVLGEPDALTQVCTAERTSTSAYVSHGNVHVFTNETAEKTETDFSPFLIGGLVTFLVGTFISWAIAIFCGLTYRRHRRAFMKEIDWAQLKGAVRVKATMLADLAFDRRRKQNRTFQHDAWAVFFGVAGLMCGVGASFLIIYFVTGYGLEGNFRVMYEEYTDAQCSQSPVAYMPTRIFAVPEGSYDCEKMESTGESAGITYATGECTGTSGSYVVSFKMGPSKESCTKDATKESVPSGTCIPIQRLDRSSTRNVYVQLTCSVAQLIAYRTAILDELTRDPDTFVQSTSRDPTPELSYGLAMIAQTGALIDTSDNADAFAIAGNEPPHTFSYLTGPAVQKSTSFVPNTIDSFATNDAFDGVQRGDRLVLQSSDCTFSSSSLFSPCMSPLEMALTPLMGSSELMGAYSDVIPSTRDVPIGHILNGFGTSTQRTWEGAGAQAHRYYGVEGTAFDMGAHFPAKRDNPTDDDGYTVSLWLRADETTQGFAYAVTDAFENPQDSVVYPLQRLGEIIANGKGGSTWYQHSYKVYQSLYVNGPGKSLVFAYASPTLTERLHLLEYDLTEIGMERVVNGLWHHVAIAFMVENGRVRAQLSVDGESSYTKAGWSVCVQEFPEPVSRFDDVVPVYSPITDTVTRGAMVVTGYFNGGVYSVKATPKALLNTDFLESGTVAMRDNNPFPRSGTLVLGAFLLVAAFLFLVFLAVSGTSTIRKMLADSDANHIAGVSDAFYSLVEEVVANSTSTGLENENNTTNANANSVNVHDGGSMRKPLSESNPNASSFTTAAGAPATANVMMGGGSSMMNGSHLNTLLQKRAQRNAASNACRSMTRIITRSPAGASEGVVAAASSDPSPLASSSTASSFLPLRPIRITTAMRWTGLQLDALEIVIDEIKAQTRPEERGEALLLLLARCKTENMGLSTISVQEWNDLVEKDAIALKEKRDELSFCFGIFRPKLDVEVEKKMMKKTEAVSFDRRFPKYAVTKEEFSDVESSTSSGSDDDDGKQHKVNGKLGFGGGAGGEGADVDHAAGDDGAEAVGDIDIGKGGKGGTAADGKVGEIAAPATKIFSSIEGFSTGVIGGLVAAFGPLLTVFQTMHVWSTSIEFPQIYSANFKEIFSFVSIDFVGAFPDVSTLVTPLVQLFVGLVAIPLIFYFMYDDNRNFNQILTQYVWRRDEIDGSGGKGHEAFFSKKEATDLDAFEKEKGGKAHAVMLKPSDNLKLLSRVAPQLSAALSDSGLTPENLTALEALPLEASRRIDLFTGRIPNVHKEEDPTDYTTLDSIDVKLTSTSSVMGGPAPMIASAAAGGGGEDDYTVTRERDAMGKPTGQVLLSQKLAPPLSNHQPPLPVRMVEVKCKRHPDTYLSPQIQTDIWPFTNVPYCCLLSGDHGGGSALCGESRGVIYRCGRVYEDEATGEMKVCNYALCEAHTRMNFVTRLVTRIVSYKRRVETNGFAWLFCVLVVMLANLAYTPFMKTALMILGCHPFYQCEFEHCWGDMDQKFALAVFCCLAVVVLFGLGFPGFLFFVLWSRKRAMDTTFLTSEYGDKYAATDGTDPRLQALTGRFISEAEWVRFTSTDATALAQQYQPVFSKWMYYPAIAIVFKVLQLLPAIFIEPRTLEQRIGCAVVQLCITLFVFVTSTQLSPVVLVTIRTAEVHNLAILGLQSIGLVVLNDLNVDISATLIIVTAIYIVFSACVFCSTVLVPIVKAMRRNRLLGRFLARQGLDFVAGISLYSNPYFYNPDTMTVDELPMNRQFTTSGVFASGEFDEDGGGAGRNAAHHQKAHHCDCESDMTTTTTAMANPTATAVETTVAEGNIAYSPKENDEVGERGVHTVVPAPHPTVPAPTILPGVVAN